MIELREQVTLDQVFSGMLASHCFASEKPLGETELPDSAEARYRLLVERGQLFLRFLPHCDWFHGVLATPEALAQIQLIAEESWFPEPERADRRLGHWATLDGLSEAHRARVDAMIGSGFDSMQTQRRVTLFGHHKNGPFSIIDGNHRLLALAHEVMCRGRDFAPVSVHVGLSQGPCRWHGDRVVWEERPEFDGKNRFVLKVW